jgi:hypothetical protein
LEFLPERRDTALLPGRSRESRHQHPNTPHALVLLRTRTQRSRHRRAAKRANEFSPS